MNKCLWLVASLIAATLSWASPAQQQSPLPTSTGNSLLASLNQDPKFLPVEQAFVFDFEQQGQQLILRWKIQDGYYLYKDKIKLAGEAVSFSHPKLPSGEPHEDEYFGKTEVYRQQLQAEVPLSDISEGALIKVRYQGCAEAGLCYPPVTVTVPVLMNQPAAQQQVLADLASPAATESNAAGVESTPAAPESEQQALLSRLQQQHGLGLLGLFFLLGLTLAFTPCVFPMYPILTSIIAGQGQQLNTRRAFGLSMAYVQGMALTYSLLGLIVASAGVKFQAYFQHPAVIWGVSGLFIVLALSMFGVITLQLPSSWSEKIHGASNAQQGGSLKGSFVMGLLSGLVASPCTTAPLTAVLLYIAQTGDLGYGALVLYVLSLGMGLPLLLLGSSGGKWLPKPGAWMDMVKNFFGFLLLTVPLLLLSRVVSDTLVTSLATLLALSFATYLLVMQQLLQKPLAKALCLLVAVSVISSSIGYQFNRWQAPSTAPATVSADANAGHFIKITSMAELEQELSNAQAAGQYVMVDLYAEWCVACKEFEHITFADATVKAEMAKIRLLQMDVTESNANDIAVLERFNVLGLPTILFFTPNQQELTASRVTGFMGPAEFAAHLVKIQQSGG